MIGQGKFYVLCQHTMWLHRIKYSFVEQPFFMDFFLYLLFANCIIMSFSHRQNYRIDIKIKYNIYIYIYIIIYIRSMTRFLKYCFHKCIHFSWLAGFRLVVAVLCLLLISCYVCHAIRDCLSSTECRILLIWSWIYSICSFRYAFIHFVPS